MNRSGHYLDSRRDPWPTPALTGFQYSLMHTAVAGSIGVQRMAQPSAADPAYADSERGILMARPDVSVGAGLRYRF